MESHKLQYKTGEELLKFMTSGKSLFTIKNSETGNRFTFKVTKLKDDNKEIYFVKVMTGSNNETDYSFIGTLFGTSTFVKNYKHSSKSNITESAQSVKVLKWLIDVCIKNTVPKVVEFYHSGHCLRCGRTLTVPESIESGYGPECIQMR